MTNVIWKEHNADGDVEYDPFGNGYLWNKANNWTVSMLDSHAEILKATPEASEFKFVAIDPNAAVEQGLQARADFANVKPGKELAAAAAPEATVQPTGELGTANAAGNQPFTNVEGGGQNA